MTIPTKPRWFRGVGVVAVIGALAFGAAALAPAVAKARVFVGFGFCFPLGFPGY
jgi:hypothetical protein